ncbi:MAG: L-serine dehydratase, partial [Octadecabacter sp.]
MFLSVFDMFKVGIGPSSSHTIGPMIAAARFLDHLRAQPFKVVGLRASLHGSLAFTGVGHSTDSATVLGLAGFRADDFDRDKADKEIVRITDDGWVEPDGLPRLDFNPKEHLKFDYGPPLEGHANGIILKGCDAQGDVVTQVTYYSIGGGFVLTADELASGADKDEGAPVMFPFKNAAEMLGMATKSGLSIADMKRQNELSRITRTALATGLDRLWQVMNDCINRGLESDGILPGGLFVKRRAKDIHDALIAEAGVN